MNNKIEVSFKGGKKVEAKIENMIVMTDQPIKKGGEGTAPAPFQLFLASIATCAGIYALEFCLTRKMSTDGMALTMTCEFDEGRKVYQKLRIHLSLPNGFPKEYERSILRVMDLNSLKKHIVHSAEFEISVGYYEKGAVA
jgi:ribosomal protein S12 methylthiotransferase accessory factor